jgi:predicted transcriptional regulator
MGSVELTIWVDDRLASWLSSKATKAEMLRHRYIENALAQLMEDQLSKSTESEVPNDGGPFDTPPEQIQS